jgi:hypothetical protein
VRPSPSHVEIEVVVDGKTQVLREQVPKGFPPELIPTLADFMRLGFEAGRASMEAHELPSLAPFAASLRGRPIDPKIEALGRKADELRKQGRTYGEIARFICPDRKPGHHRCGKKCADRIRQAHLSFLNREDLRSMTDIE